MIYYTAHPDRSQDKNKPSSIYEFSFDDGLFLYINICIIYDYG